MSEFRLHKFKFISFEIPSPTYSQIHRFVDALAESGQLDCVWQQLHFCRVLKFKRDHFAYDNYVLLSVLAERYPNHSITVQIVPVKSEAALHQCILANLLVSSLSQLNALRVPAFERRTCKNLNTAPLFGASKWAQILDVHRSTLYPKTKTPVSTDTASIDTDAVLKDIPLPNMGGRA